MSSLQKLPSLKRQAASAQEVEIEGAVETIAETLRLLGGCRLFPAFGPSDACAVTEMLLARVRDGAMRRPWQLVPALAAVLGEWARARGEPLDAGLLLVAQSAAIRDISVDAWGEGEEANGGGGGGGGGPGAGAAKRRRTRVGGGAAAEGGDDDDDVEMTEAGKAEEEEEERGGNPLVGKSSFDIGEYLVRSLKEPPPQISMFKNLADALGPEGIWEVLEAANQALKENSPVTKTVDGKPRSGGGLFIRLANERIAKAKKAAAVQPAPVFQLRDYQVRAVERIRNEGGNWVVAAPTNAGKTAIFIEIAKLNLAANPASKTLVLVPTVSLATQQCIAFEKAGFLGPAPAANPATGTVSTSPSSSKHPVKGSAPSRSGAGGPQPSSRFRVDCFFSDHQLRPECWKEELGRLSVLVMEAGSFRNLLLRGAARLEELDLVVLDECHHTLRNHAYAVIMNNYEPTAGKPQVLGFSASPAGGGSVEQVHANLETLLQRLHAKVHVIPDEEVEAVAPAPEVQEQRVACREEDVLIQRQLVQAMQAVALKIGLDLQALSRQGDAGSNGNGSDSNGVDTGNRAGSGGVGMPADVAAASGPAACSAAASETGSALAEAGANGSGDGSNGGPGVGSSNDNIPVGGSSSGLGPGGAPLDPRTRAELQQNVESLQRAMTSALLPGKMQDSYNVLCMWAHEARDLAVAWGLRNLGFGLHLLEVLRRCSELAEDVGQECALQVLGRQLLSLAARSEAAAVAAAAAAAAAAAPAPPAAKHPRLSALAALRERVETGPDPAEIAAAKALKNAQPLVNLAELPSPGDIPTTALELCRLVLNGLPFLSPPASLASDSSSPSPHSLALQLVSEVVGAVVPGWLRPPPACPPKIWQLVEFLQRYKDRREFHGIVFSRTRQGAHYLAEVLRAACTRPLAASGGNGAGGCSNGEGEDKGNGMGDEPPLGFIQAVYVFVGHGTRTRRSAAVAGDDLDPSVAAAGSGSRLNERLAARGMSATKQLEVLEQFKAPGCRLLVATNAAEEGMDIPCCEFVVRFSPAATGIQRVQAKGRGRKLGSVYYCLMQTGGKSLDEQLHLKSAGEEEAMRTALAKLVHSKARVAA